MINTAEIFLWGTRIAIIHLEPESSIVTFEYDNNPNSLVIVTKYDEEKVLSVKADVYSDNNMFSTTLVKDSIKDYFYNFNYEINENLIKEAFDKRFESAVKENNATYKVTEIYEKKELTKLKTSIKLNLN